MTREAIGYELTLNRKDDSASLSLTHNQHAHVARNMHTLTHTHTHTHRQTHMHTHARTHTHIHTHTHTHTHLAGQNVSKGTESVVECLVVDGLVQVLDEDVAHARLAQGGVTLRPHDAHRAALQGVEIHRVQSSFSCGGMNKVNEKLSSITHVTGGYQNIGLHQGNTLTVGWLLKVDIGVAEGAASDDIATHANGDYGAGLAKLLEERGLVYVRVEVADVERSYRVTGRCLHRHLRDVVLGLGVLNVGGGMEKAGSSVDVRTPQVFQFSTFFGTFLLLSFFWVFFSFFETARAA